MQKKIMTNSCFRLYKQGNKIHASFNTLTPQDLNSLNKSHRYFNFDANLI